MPCSTPRPRLRLRSCRPAPAPPHLTCQQTLANARAAPLVGLRRAPGPAASPDSPYPSSSARHRVALPGFASLPPLLLVQGREEEAEGEGRSAQQVRLRFRTEVADGDRPSQPRRSNHSSPSSCTLTRWIPRTAGTRPPLSPCPHCPVQPVSTVPRLLHWSCKQILAKTAKSLDSSYQLPGKISKRSSRKYTEGLS